MYVACIFSCSDWYHAKSFRHFKNKGRNGRIFYVSDISMYLFVENHFRNWNVYILKFTVQYIYIYTIKCNMYVIVLMKMY